MSTSQTACAFVENNGLDAASVCAAVAMLNGLERWSHNVKLMQVSAGPQDLPQVVNILAIGNNPTQLATNWSCGKVDNSCCVPRIGSEWVFSCQTYIIAEITGAFDATDCTTVLPWGASFSALVVQTAKMIKSAGTRRNTDFILANQLWNTFLNSALMEEDRKNPAKCVPIGTPGNDYICQVNQARRN